MARVAITVQECPANGGRIADITWTAVDATNDHYFINDGRTILLINNGDGSTRTATIAQAAADSFGPTSDTTVAVAAGDEAIAGPFPTALYNQSGTDIGKTYVSFDAATTVDIAAIRLLGSN